MLRLAAPLLPPCSLLCPPSLAPPECQQTLFETLFFSHLNGTRCGRGDCVPHEDNRAPVFPNTPPGPNDGALLASRKSSFHAPSCEAISFSVSSLSVLDVYVLSTDGQVHDFRFPQTSKGGATLQLSSNTVKVNSKNGERAIISPRHLLP